MGLGECGDGTDQPENETKKKHFVSFCGKYEMNRFKKRKRSRDLTKVFYKIFQKTRVHFV